MSRPRGDDALVRNASDEQQVARAKRLEEKRRSAELADLKALLGTAEGRRVCWRLLEFCGLHRTVYDHSGSQMNVKVGMQNVGLFLQAEIADADEEALFTMQREAKARQKADAVENTSTRTNSSENEEQQT